MIKMKTRVTWDNGMTFSGLTESGHRLVLDASPEDGGSDSGPRPTELLLHAAAVCTGMDIVLVLKKMRLEMDNFSVDIEGERASSYPKRLTNISITYHINGDLPEDKVIRAINLSKETYCTVVHSLNASFSYYYSLNGKPRKILN